MNKPLLKLANIQPFAFMMRHGDTELNDAGKFRGWVDVKLNAKGRKDAEEAGNYLKSRGIKPIKIVCSDFSRTHETAQIISKILDPIPISTDSNLRPWHLGDLSGKSKEENNHILEELIKNPDSYPPGKESETLNEFIKRNNKAIDDYLKGANKEGIIVIIAHTSNIVSALEGKTPEKTEVVQPGGIVEIIDGENGIEFKPVFKAKEMKIA